MRLAAAPPEHQHAGNALVRSNHFWDTHPRFTNPALLLCGRVVSEAPVGVQPRKTQRWRDFYLDTVILAILLLAIWNICQHVLVPQQGTNLGCDLGQLFQPAHLEKPAAGLLADFAEQC